MVCLVLCGCALFAGFARGDEKAKVSKAFKAAVGVDGVQHVEILGGSYFFAPNHIIVKVNVPVELKVRKESGIVPHNIVINAPEAGISFNVSLSDKPETVKFTPTRIGTFPMYCDKKLLFFPSHRDEGMEGVLEVTE